MGNPVILLLLHELISIYISQEAVRNYHGVIAQQKKIKSRSVQFDNMYILHLHNMQF
jgi:hypothetical protein